MTYRPDGRPLAVEVTKTPAPSCDNAVAAIAWLSNAYFSDPARQPREVLLPMFDDTLSCAENDVEELFVTPPEEKSAGVREPRLTHEVKPTYPREAQDRRLEGVVQMEGVLSSAGCIAALRVTRSLWALDRQTLQSVLQWRFDPGAVAGRAVPMVVNVELTFTLK